MSNEWSGKIRIIKLGEGGFVEVTMKHKASELGGTRYGIKAPEGATLTGSDCHAIAAALLEYSNASQSEERLVA